MIDIVDRLIYEGSDLSLEAAERILSLRTRAKFWEKQCKRIWIPKYFSMLINVSDVCLQEREKCLRAIDKANDCGCGAPCDCFTVGTAKRAIKNLSN